MKDIMVKTCPSAETVYKDVVIIGNGPSGITLSYMLAGHWPYWIPEKIERHPDELLRARLTYADNNKSLVEQDLVNLADGLEGRSTNPVSLLLDSLQNPCADLGMEVPSLLQYKYDPDKQIDHVVLGKGAPGGSWHRMDPNLRTLSLSAWMSLPGLDFGTWNEAHPDSSLTNCRSKKRPILKSLMNNNNLLNNSKEQYNNVKCKQCKRQPFNSICRLTSTNSSKHSISINNDGEQGALCCRHSREIVNGNDAADDSTSTRRTVNVEVTLNSDSTINNKIVPTELPRRILSVKRQQSKEVQTRALVSRVAEYYENYVSEMGLDKYFCNDTVVTSVRPIHNCTINKKAQWLVTGFRLKSGRTFSYVCRSVVLANGASDLANRLGLHGEDQASGWIKHDLTQLELALTNLPDKERSKLKPVVIVGAGLSAADAVTICRSSGINVIHVYRNRSAGLDKMLPENVYPEYHEVHKMMKDCVNTYDLYTPLPEHKIIEFTQSIVHPNENKITVQHLTTGDIRTFEVSFCAILIGSRPDLRFLSHTSNPSATNNLLCDDIHIDQISNDDLQRQHQQQLQQQHQWSLLTKKITWLKNLCAKCKHLNLCDRSRRNEGCRRISCYQNQLKQCECFDKNNFNNNNNDINQYNNNNNTLPVVTQIHSDDVKTPKICTIDENLSAIGIGEDPSKPVDCKTNPISVDKFTNEVLRAPKGLFAMGPLVGDNFIRFISGGALAITSSLHKEND